MPRRRPSPMPEADRDRYNSMRPATTPEGRETQLMSMAYDLVERRFREGTASAQETTYFLKLSNRKARLEEQILENQAALIKAKTEAVKSQRNIEELYRRAMDAMKSYAIDGDDQDILDEEDDYDD